MSCEVDAEFVIARYVVVASVVVPYLVNKRSRDEDALTKRPMVEVGESAKCPRELVEVSSNVFPNEAPPSAVAHAEPVD